MGIRNWFRRKQERTPGGSVVTHPTPKTPHEMLGITPGDTVAFAEQRERAYEEFFGEPEFVHHEVLPMVPHIDVFVYPPGHASRPSYTLVSGGMSDMRMHLPKGLDRSHGRREIILYCDTPDEEYITLVRRFARFPFEYSTWLGHGHTIPNGNPPAPIFENSELIAAFLLYTIVRPDDGLAERVVLDGDPVRFLWLVPITQAELDCKLNQGCDALLEVLDRAKHPVVLNPRRASYL